MMVRGIGLEGDSVRLRVEYSVNGVDWNRASIVGDIDIAVANQSSNTVSILKNRNRSAAISFNC